MFELPRTSDREVRFGGETENICSLRAFRLLTPFRTSVGGKGAPARASSSASIQNDSGLPPCGCFGGNMSAVSSLRGFVVALPDRGEPMSYMRRREFITLLGGAAAAWPLAARGQQSAKIYRVAYLALVGDRDAMIVKQRLDELGYSEGRNLVFDFRSAQGRPERLPELAAELVTTNPDIIVASFGTATAKAAQGATATIPVVFTSVGDPIGTGIVKSLSRCGLFPAVCLRHQPMCPQQCLEARNAREQ
jgi:ABC transporter substrate binding protein